MMPSYLLFGFTAIVGLVILVALFLVSTTAVSTHVWLILLLKRKWATLALFPTSGQRSKAEGKRQKGCAENSKAGDVAGGPEGIPGWASQPHDDILGDTKLVAEHGSLHQYLRHRHARDGPIIAFWWTNQQRIVSLASPDLFKATIKLFDRPEIMFDLLQPLITSSSIQYANYEDGRQRRAVYDPAFQHEALVNYFNVFVKCGEAFAAKFESPSSRESVPLVEEAFQLTIQSLCQSSFGDMFADQEEVKTLSEAYHICWSEMEQRLGGSVPEVGSAREKRFEENKAIFFRIVRRIIDCRRSSASTSAELPFIDALLSAQLPEATTESDAVSYLIGGFHTSGYFLVWSLYYLGTHPDVQDKLHQEILQHVGREGPMQYKDIKEMGYLRQVQNEVLRVSILGPYAARFSDEEVVVGGYTLPPKTPIVQALGVVLKDSTIWPEPSKFDPERFSPTESHQRHPLAFVPFGFAGKRKCPGYLFTYTEVGAFLVILIRKYKVSMVTEGPVEKVYGLVTSPKDEIFAKLDLRGDSSE